MRVAVLFTDGVGVGPQDASTNPLMRAEYLLSQFEGNVGVTLPHGGTRHDVDATFGIPGRPQSASNQTAMWTTQPAPQLLGRHVLGYPNGALKALLAQHSIVKSVTASGLRASFANAYPSAYLDALGLARSAGLGDSFSIPTQHLKRLKASASTLAMAAGAVRLRTFEDAQNNAGLTHDVDGQRAQQRHPTLPLRSPQQAAEIFWNLAADFTLFEHYLADEAGHAQDETLASVALGTFDAFARAVVASRPSDAQVLICSDHGNVEDLSTRTHTRNPVAILSFGPSTLPPLETVADVGVAALAILGLRP